MSTPSFTYIEFTFKWKRGPSLSLNSPLCSFFSSSNTNIDNYASKYFSEVHGGNLIPGSVDANCSAAHHAVSTAHSMHTSIWMVGGFNVAGSVTLLLEGKLKSPSMNAGLLGKRLTYKCSLVADRVTSVGWAKQIWIVFNAEEESRWMDRRIMTHRTYQTLNALTAGRFAKMSAREWYKDWRQKRIATSDIHVKKSTRIKRISVL